MENTRIGIIGFGNVGRGVLKSINKNPDLELTFIASRNTNRVLEELACNPSLATREPSVVVPIREDTPWQYLEREADVAILCGGSKKDLPEQGPFFAKHFNTVDSFDTHGHIPPYTDDVGKQMQGYKADVDAAARASGHLSVISTGWDPGIFTLEKLMAEAFMAGAKAYAFYGLEQGGGLSMGHSDAVRQIPGVADARSYTFARPEAIDLVRAGKNPNFKPGDMHTREVYVVLKIDSPEERDRVESKLKSDPMYFRDYETTVHFNSQERMDEAHQSMRHDGLVIAVSPEGNIIEHKLKLTSNPDFTAGVMVRYARAIHRMHSEGKGGAIGPTDVPVSYLLPLSDEQITRRI